MSAGGPRDHQVARQKGDEQAERFGQHHQIDLNLREAVRAGALYANKDEDRRNQESCDKELGSGFVHLIVE